ncbi:MAG: LemA family protein [Phycisphaerae bacterium]|nr:MAG: LemA family protein [Phycisphaerae bacterium]
MKSGIKLLAFVAVLFFGAVIVGGCMTYSGYNRAVSLDETVKEKWAQVENQLQRRYELVPNLVETVKGIAGQEKDVFLGISKSREAYFNAAKGNSRGDKIKAAQGLEGALSRLLVLRESYPELKSNESFLKLQDSLEGTENRLAVERKRFNESVSNLNKFRRKLLGRLYAGLAGVEEADYFEVSEAARETPKVDFSDKDSDD